MMRSDNLLPLNQLKPGTSGTIVHLNVSGQLLQRLLSMGFTRGADITLVRHAPMKDPIQFKIKGTSVSLRKGDAENVLVTVN